MEYTWVEHPDVIKTAIYILATTVIVVGASLIAVLRWAAVWVMDRFSADLAEVKDTLNKLTDTMGSRVSRVEKDVDNLWVEHRTIKEMGGCRCGHHHSRQGDNHDYANHGGD